MGGSLRPWRAVGSTLREAFQLLTENDYRVFLLKGEGLYEFPYEIYREFYHYANFVAFPGERASELSHLIRGPI
jgi:hypothetical protein